MTSLGSHLVQIGLGLFALFLIGWITRYWLIPFWIRRSLYQRATGRLKRAYHVFKQVVRRTGPGLFASYQPGLRHNPQQRHLIYGEIDFLSFAEILQKVHPKANDVFVDLGSGTGKAVIAAALLYPMKKAVGIELMPHFHDVAAALLEKLTQLETTLKRPLNHADIQFLQGDFLSIPWENEATLVFINATAFGGQLWANLVSKCSRLPKGSRIIVTSHSLPATHFKRIYHGRHLMAFGLNRLSIYQVGD